MRFLVLLTIPVIPLITLSQQSDAEKLFRSMETQLRTAKAIKIGFEIELEGPVVGGGKVRGAVYVTAGNKARIDIGGNLGGKEMTSTMIADGKQSLYTETPVTVKSEPKPVEPMLSLALPQFVARSGVFAAMNINPSKDAFDIDKFMQIGAFKLGKKEKVGVRETQPVDCELKLSDGKVLQMTTWLDTVTNFPLKRRVVVETPDKKSVSTITEVYTEFTLNPQLDVKLFELPK